MTEQVKEQIMDVVQRYGTGEHRALCVRVSAWLLRSLHELVGVVSNTARAKYSSNSKIRQQVKRLGALLCVGGGCGLITDTSRSCFAILTSHHKSFC